MSSCDKFQHTWAVWEACWSKHWPDCPFSHRIMTNHISGDRRLPIGHDEGWNASLIKSLQSVHSDNVLLALEDQWLSPCGDLRYTENALRCEQILDTHSEIGAVRMGVGAECDGKWEGWDLVGILDREPHPFKRTTLYGPTMYKKSFLERIASAVLANITREEDRGRDGALAFEIKGTHITRDSSAFPETILQAYDRPRTSDFVRPYLLAFYNHEVFRVSKFNASQECRRAIEDAVGPLENFPGMAPFLT